VGNTRAAVRDRAQSVASNRRVPQGQVRISRSAIAIAAHEVKHAALTRVDRHAVASIHVIPSAFNTSELVARLSKPDRHYAFLHFRFSTLRLSPDTRMVINPRSCSAHSATPHPLRDRVDDRAKPMTSVELARV